MDFISCHDFRRSELSLSLIYNSRNRVYWLKEWQQPYHVSLQHCLAVHKTQIFKWQQLTVRRWFTHLILQVSMVRMTAGTCFEGFTTFSRVLLSLKVTWLNQHRLPHCNPQNIFNLFINPKQLASLFRVSCLHPFPLELHWGLFNIKGPRQRVLFFVTEDQEDQVALIAFLEEQQQIPKHLNGKVPQHECGSVVFIITHDCFFPSHSLNLVF